MKLADYSIKHPAVITIILVAIVVFGLIAVQGSNQEAFPPMGLAGASIITVYPGVGAEYIETEITSQIEDALSSLSGLSKLESSSRDSASVVSVSLRDGEDAFAKLPEIREKINSVRDELPEGISGEPEIFIHDSGSVLPVYSVMIKSNLDREVFSNFVNGDFIPQISRLPGVSKVQVKGGIEKELQIKLHLDELEPREISVLDIFSLLKHSNLSFPGGKVNYQGKELDLRTSGEFSSISEIENLVVGFVDSSFIYLKDVADISFRTSDPDFFIRSAGENVIAVDVMKREEGNAIDIVNGIHGLQAETIEKYPGSFEFFTITDQKDQTNLTINTVARSGLTGIILAILIIYIFLHNIRSTLIIGLSLPISILITFIGMYLTKTSLNMLSLSGITVAIGMIVDSSIVVLENTNSHFSAGKSSIEAASLGAGEVGGAVLASATTSICVFLPMVFLTGIIGIVMKGLSLTIVLALGSSAIVSVIIVPYMSALFLKREQKQIKFLEIFHGTIEKGIQALIRGYRRLLSKAINKPFVIIIIAIVILALTVFLVTNLGVSFLPPTDTGELEIHITTPEFYSLEETLVKTDEIDRRIRELVPEIESAIYYVGAESTMASTTTQNASTGRIRLIGTEERDRSVQDIITFLQADLGEGITDAEIFVVNGGFDALVGLATGGQGFKLRIFGSSLDEVMLVAEKAENYLRDDPEVLKTDASMKYGREEIVSNLILDYMGSLGITPYEAAITSLIFFGGVDAGKYRSNGENFNIVLLSDVAGEKIDEDTINLINLRTSSNKIVSMSSFTELETRPTVSVINKQDQNISLTLTAYLNTTDQLSITQRVTEYMNSSELPYGTSWSVGGTSSLISDSFKSLFLILGIAVFLVYMVMVIQFERFIQPVIILISVPFCLIGVILGLMLFGSIISIIPMLGIISLAGIVVNNAIVMIDYINLLVRRGGISLEKAVLDGCISRLKPILMTTLTTFFGVLPMAFTSGNGSEIYAPLGQAIAGGLITSTCLTLFLVPAIFTLVEKRHPSQTRLKQPI
ncbi:MAG: efflux RND transporter permease subunit [Spirochaetales bacterium]|nr:efflux RND transporter permease subunit [Spirochaetales bacterium]